MDFLGNVRDSFQRYVLLKLTVLRKEGERQDSQTFWGCNRVLSYSVCVPYPTSGNKRPSPLTRDDSRTWRHYV